MLIDNSRTSNSVIACEIRNKRDDKVGKLWKLKKIAYGATTWKGGEIVRE